MNYKQQLEVITGLFVPPDTAMRMDCPFCSGKNTLSVDTMNNNINWYCFHASCSAKGKYQGEKNMNCECYIQTERRKFRYRIYSTR